MASKILIIVAAILLVPNYSSAAKDSPIPSTLSIKAIMKGNVMPAAEVIWDATAVYVTQEGEDDRSPKNDEDWRKVDLSRIALEDAIKALLVSGRIVDEPGTVSEHPEEELSPYQIEAMIKREPDIWVAMVGALDDTVQQAKKAIEDRDVEALTEIGGAIDEACENCHMHFWYPEN
jgi:hypothetical protein